MFFAKKCSFFKVLFRDEGHLYTNCLFSMLTIYPKCHRFLSFSRGIRMYIPILTSAQNEHISHLKDSTFLLKTVLFEGSVWS